MHAYVRTDARHVGSCGKGTGAETGNERFLKSETREGGLDWTNGRMT